MTKSQEGRMEEVEIDQLRFSLGLTQMNRIRRMFGTKKLGEMQGSRSYGGIVMVWS